jgi:phosphoglycolate phosphatase-like HAD superfamily hydrolase
MNKRLLLSKYFKSEDIIAKEDQAELKPSPRGLTKLKERLSINDWEMLYVGDGYDDYLAAKGANVFFSLIVQGLVGDVLTLRGMKNDSDFGAAYHKIGKSTLPKFLVSFNYNELHWWFRENPLLQKQIKAVCFDLGDTLVLGGREEAYTLTDKNWPTWDVDRLLSEGDIDKNLKKAILNMQIGNKWRKLGNLPAMNSSEVRIASFFLLNLFDLTEKDLVTVLYSVADKEIRKNAEKISRQVGLTINTKTVPQGATVKDLPTIFPPEQFSSFIAAGLLQTLSDAKSKFGIEDVSLALRASFIWISEYRKNEVESYKKHCNIPNGLKEFLDFLQKKRKKMCIYTSKSRNIVETTLSFEKDIAPA